MPWTEPSQIEDLVKVMLTEAFLQSNTNYVEENIIDIPNTHIQ